MGKYETLKKCHTADSWYITVDLNNGTEGITTIRKLELSWDLTTDIHISNISPCDQPFGLFFVILLGTKWPQDIDITLYYMALLLGDIDMQPV